jgi:hypothetical protein
MKTDDLIAALAADAPVVSKPIGRTMLLAVAAGAGAASIVFFLALGVRPDFSAAMETPRFLLKCFLTLTLLASALGLVFHLARPGAVPDAWVMTLAAAPVLLVIAMLVELSVVPHDEWMVRLMGRNAVVCMVLIPALATLPLIATLFALRQGAPTNPTLAGAVAGLLAGGIGATLYATHCPDDSPLFIAAWYVIAIVIVTFIGAIAGARLLRW